MNQDCLEVGWRVCELCGHNIEIVGKKILLERTNMAISGVLKSSDLHKN